MARGEPLSRVELTDGDEERPAVLSYVVGLGSGSEGQGLPAEVSVELLDWT